jgi:hypothetical protein
MERNAAERTVLVLHREHPRALWIEADGRERDDLFPLCDPVVVAERVRALAKLGVPPDAMEQASSGCISFGRHAIAASSPITCPRPPPLAGIDVPFLLPLISG